MKCSSHAGQHLVPARTLAPRGVLASGLNNHSIGDTVFSCMMEGLANRGNADMLRMVQAQGWATGLSAGVAEGGHERSSAAWLFDVALTLTDAGLSAPPGAGLAPVALLFQFLSLLRQRGPQE